MTTTPLLSIDEMAASQAGKYLTFNEAVRAIEALTIRVLDIRTSAPPGSPSDGDCYICGSGSISGDWSGFSVDDLAYYDSGWYNLTPFEGLRVWVNDENKLYVWNGSTWSVLASDGNDHAQSHAITSTSDHTAGTWKLFYSNGSGNVIELALADAGKLLTAQGVSAAPTFEDNLSIRRLGTATAGMQTADGKTDVFTVPSGKSCIVTHVIVRNPTGSLAGGTDFDLGDGANADTWKTAVDLSGLTATTDCIIINQTAKFTVFDAGDVFGIKPVTGATGDYDATVEVFGYLF